MHILFNILFMILIKMLSPVNSQIQIRDTLVKTILMKACRLS